MPDARGAQPPGGLAHCFVYYRVAERDLASAQACVLAFQQALRTEPAAVPGTLMRRPGAADGSVTLMETYALPAGAPAALRERLAAGPAELLPLLASQRHLEEFEPCA